MLDHWILGRNSSEKVSRTCSLPVVDTSFTTIPTERLLQHNISTLPTIPQHQKQQQPHYPQSQQQPAFHQRSPLASVEETPNSSSPPSHSESVGDRSSATAAYTSASLNRCPSLSSLSSFAESLVTSPSKQQQLKPSQHQKLKTKSHKSPQAQSSLASASSSTSLVQEQHGALKTSLPARDSLASGNLTRSTPNLDETEDGSMVTKSSKMYSYLHNGSPSASKGSDSSKMKKPGRYWETNPSDSPDRENYAHHLRSSSYQVLHSQQQLNQGPSANYHARQQSNTSNYSESDDFNTRQEQKHINSSYSPHCQGQPNADRTRYLSYDSIGPETAGHKYQTTWNISEPDLTASPHNSQNTYYPHISSHKSHSSLYHHNEHQQNASLHNSPAVLHNSINMHHSSNNLHSSPSNNSYNASQPPPPPPPLRQSPSAPSYKHPSSPPPPPVRDASSLKYIKYGPGHEKFPSWPVPAGSANQVMNSVSEHDPSGSGLSDSLTGPQGSHRSKSWTEQSDYPKDQSGGYTRPHHKKQLNPAYQQQLRTVMENSEKIPPQSYESKHGDDLLPNPNCSLMDSFFKSDSSYYPLYDRDGHGIDDKDYNIPSPPERDPGMGEGEANLSQVTAAQLEEYSRHYDYPYGDMVGVTPFLDRLREESAGWDGGSERDSGRGESESMADSFRYSNGRESVTTVVTNSSSASSSETLKWHGSSSDISIMSGQSRDTRTDQNIVHSSRVLPPQRQNSESVLYYGSDKGRKQSKPYTEYRTREGNTKSPRDLDPNFSRGLREARWNREVERNNEVNNLKKFPSYSYTQPLSQINEAPSAEQHETSASNHPAKSPTIDISKPPSVAERISELERQSRNPIREQSQRFRDASESRERTGSRETGSMQEGRRRDLSEPRGEYREEAENPDSKNISCMDYGHLSLESNTMNTAVVQLENISDYRPDTSSNAPLNSTDLSLSSHNMSTPSTRNISDRMNHDPETISTNVNHIERDHATPLKNFAYLDPKKQCKVPDSTLKNIQKQALMSYYERRTGKKSVSSSSLGDHSHASQFTKPPSPLVSKNSFSTRSGSNIREDRSGLAGISLARLGRIPDAENDSPSRPPRKRSVNSRADLKEDNVARENSESLRSSLSESSISTGETQSSYPASRKSSLPLSTASPEPPPVPPPPGVELRHADDAQEHSRPSNITRPATLPPTALDDHLPPRPPERPPKKANLRPLFPNTKDLAAVSSAINNEDIKPGRPYYYRRPPAPDPPTSPDGSPLPVPRPLTPSISESNGLVIESNLCGDQHNSTAVSSQQHRFQRGILSHTLSLAPCHSSLPSIGQGNVPPPLSPTIQALTAQASRSSTPDLPPPPPLPQNEPESTFIHDEEPLPPPPSEVTRSNSKNSKSGANQDSRLSHNLHPYKKSRGCSESSSTQAQISFSETAASNSSNPQYSSSDLNCRSRSPPHPPTPKTPPPSLEDEDNEVQEKRDVDGTYHKDSYMAQKKDWKSGFEGRYRRTSSPSASPVRNSLPRCPEGNVHSSVHTLAHHSSTKCLNTYNSSYSALSGAAMLSSSTMALTSYPSNASSSGSSSLSSSLSSTSSKSKSGSHLTHSVSSTSSSSNSSAGSSTPAPRQQIYNPHIKPIIHDNDSHITNNSSGWSGHARQVSTTVNFTSEELRAFRSRKAAGEGGYFHSSASRTLPLAISTPALVQPSSYSSQTTSSNQGSSSSLASATLDSPAKISPSTSLRTSLDSLNCPRVPSSSRPRIAHESLPRTVSVTENISIGATESLSRCTSAVDSLSSRSTSVADSLYRSSSVAETTSSLSRTSSINEPTAPSPISLASTASLSDGAVIARPATVTEELPPFYPSSEHNPSEAYEFSLPSNPGTINVESLEDLPSPLTHLPRNDSQPINPSTSSVDAEPTIFDSVDTKSESQELPSLPNTPLSPSPLSLPPSTPPPVIPAYSSCVSAVAGSPSSSPPTPPSAPPPLDLPTPLDTITIGYGRNRRPEELECDQLSMEYVSRLGLDPRLQALLAPGPELKTTADYMGGVFTYEVRRDILATRAQQLLPKPSLHNGTDNNISNTSANDRSSTLNSQDTSSNFPGLRYVDKSLNRLNSVPSSDVNSSLSSRFTNSSSVTHDTITSLNNNKLSCTPVSRSSSYLGASPVHLSSANQVANFTSISSPIRPHDTKSHFLATRSLSSPEHPNTFNSSLSSPIVNETDTLANGEETFASDEPRRKTSGRSPLPSDSAYFTTSESKARLLTRLRSPSIEGAETGSNTPSSPTIADSHALQLKKEELMTSIGRKLDILRAEQEAIKEEMRLNNELGAEVTERVEQQAKPQETDKYKLHVEEIDKITSLLLGLSGRLARAENALLLLSQQDGPELKQVLEQKRDRLSEQLEEAMLLKENIDRRAGQVEKTLMQYLTDAEFTDYDHFIKMKTKLVMDAREIGDKIKLGEEQTAALRAFKSKDDSPKHK